MVPSALVSCELLNQWHLESRWAHFALASGVRPGNLDYPLDILFRARGLSRARIQHHIGRPPPPSFLASGRR
eukprot:gene11641-biopygen12426